MSSEAASGKTVRPRPAASLLIVKHSATGPEILMGRRPSKSAFMPSVYVFPGGRVDTLDLAIEPGQPLDMATRRMLEAQDTKLPSAAIANAAIRETFEETGLVFSAPGICADDPQDSWAAFAKHGAPDHAALTYLGRAITPSSSPIRFHARFFIAPAERAKGDIQGSGELLDLAFVPIAEALKLPIIDVTELMLKEVISVIDTPARARPFLSYRQGATLLRFEDMPRGPCT